MQLMRHLQQFVPLQRLCGLNVLKGHDALAIQLQLRGRLDAGEIKHIGLWQVPRAIPEIPADGLGAAALIDGFVGLFGRG